MKIIYKNGIINVDKIIEDTGILLLAIENYSKVSRILYPKINDFNQYKLKLSLDKKQKYDICLYEANSEEEVERVKTLIIDSHNENKDINLTIPPHLDFSGPLNDFTEIYKQEKIEADKMMNFRNIQELVKVDHICINIDEGRYSCSYFMGIDFPLRSGEHYNFYKRECIRDYIDDANSPGDIDAYNAECKLIEFSNMHKEFLFTKAKTIEDGYKILEEKAELWLQLDYYEQINLLDEFILFEVGENF